jgi:hypothetical protein
MSRVDPNSITVLTFGSQRFIVLPRKNTQCICISLIYIHDCTLVFGKPIGETMNKKVGGVLHIQEHDCLISHFCIQYNMVAQLGVNRFGWVLPHIQLLNRDTFLTRNGASVEVVGRYLVMVGSEDLEL